MWRSKASSPKSARDIRGTKAALLVSIHDVSPLTLENSQRAVEVALDAGVPIEAMTILVIPRHEDRISIDEHPTTCAWLRGLAERGAQLVMHGYTHRMVGSPRTPWRWFATRCFARNQGELAVCDALFDADVIPAADLVKIKDTAAFTVDAVKKREEITNHDVADFPFDPHPSGPVGDVVDLLGLGVVVLLSSAADGQARLRQALVADGRVPVRQQFADLRAVFGCECGCAVQIAYVHTLTINALRQA